MVQHITDSNIQSLRIGGLSNSVLFFAHSEHTQLNYRSSASLKFVGHGRVQYTINGQKVSLREGNYLFVNSGSEVSTTISEPTQGLSIFFDDQLAITEDLHFLPILDLRLLGSLTSEIHEMEMNGSTCQLKEIKSMMYNYLVEISMYMDRLHHKSSRARVESLKKLLLARHYIESNLLANLRIDELSQEAMISKHELIRRFKEVFGVTPYRHFLRSKIELSKVDLLQGKTLSQIADTYSIPDVFTYSKLFKKITGKTPTQFKQNQAA